MRRTRIGLLTDIAARVPHSDDEAEERRKCRTRSHRRIRPLPTWRADGQLMDQMYYGRIIDQHGWTAEAGDIVALEDVTCLIHTDPIGGMRAGRY